MIGPKPRTVWQDLLAASPEVESYAGSSGDDGIEITISGKDGAPISPTALYLVKLAIREHHLSAAVKITIRNGRDGVSEAA